MTVSDVNRYHVGADDLSQRLDQVAARWLAKHSRSQVTAYIGRGHILVNGQRKKPSYRLKAGDCLSAELPNVLSPQLAPEPIPLDILFEDPDLLVLNKPAGMVVHPAPGHSTATLVNALLHHYPPIKDVGEADRPGIVHRLDQDTSGVLVVAKAENVRLALVNQFKARRIAKMYLALVKGLVRPSAGIIDKPIGRHRIHRKKMTVAYETGRSAITHWQVLERYDDVTLLELELKTGRTHQVRVHCADWGHPILGDRLYGRSGKRKQQTRRWVKNAQVAITRQMLHAWKIGFNHPLTGAWQAFEAPLPTDMKTVLAWFARSGGRGANGKLP
jgi:23S rRNA pseudouridine1911/1915/1917 synthase